MKIIYNLESKLDNFNQRYLLFSIIKLIISIITLVVLSLNNLPPNKHNLIVFIMFGIDIINFLFCFIIKYISNNVLYNTESSSHIFINSLSKKGYYDVITLDKSNYLDNFYIRLVSFSIEWKQYLFFTYGHIHKKETLDQHNITIDEVMNSDNYNNMINRLNNYTIKLSSDKKKQLTIKRVIINTTVKDGKSFDGELKDKLESFI